jgi:hypothetical protein|tara:strand:+ start:1493 stop:1669 length:177 start_codon:yes stop_codon:yes gene_type:complete
MEWIQHAASEQEQALAMITELIEIGVPVEKLHQQGIAEFDIEYVDMQPEDGLWSDLFD